MATPGWPGNVLALTAIVVVIAVVMWIVKRL